MLAKFLALGIALTLNGFPQRRIEAEQIVDPRCSMRMKGSSGSTSPE